MKKKKVIFRLSTESGDRDKVIFDHYPTEEELETKLREEMPGEWVENADGKFNGPGFHGSYIYIEDEDVLECD